MVFSSVPGYLDPPNWQQQPVVNRGDENPQFQPPVPPPPPLAGVGTSGSIRPVSMTERARLAQLPIPETALKCPRCESTNTKFCYFNNYNLTQPRHFCKTCRRYWTRGGTLRNVPVGGGCRRNKRNKRNSRSKSPVITAAGNSSNNSAMSNMMVQLAPPPLQQLPLLPYYGGAGNIGLSFEGAGMGFQMGNSSSTVARFSEQWRMQQLQQSKHFPLLEQPAGIYQFQGEEAAVEASNYQFESKPLDSGVSHDQLGGAVKMEENQGLNLAKNFLGTNQGNDQYYGGHAWTDLCGFTSSTTTHLL